MKPTPFPGSLPPIDDQSLTVTYRTGDLAVSVTIGAQSLRSIAETVQDMLPADVAPLQQALSAGQVNVTRRILGVLASYLNGAADVEPLRAGPKRAEPIRFSTAEEVRIPDGE